jgi:membrane fusion protein (multidrug efflux system)
MRRFQEYRMYRAQAIEAERAAKEAIPVKAYRVRPRDVAGAFKRIGTIRARAETNLQFGAPGRVERFDAEKGQFVKKGALIAALDQAEARNALNVAQLEYEKANVKYFRDRTIDRLTYEQAKARYNQARLEADKTVIRAGHDGYLVEKWLNVGEHADPGTVIGKLMDKSRVTIEMDLSEDDIQHLKTGQKVAITVDAVPDYKEEGVVLSITPYLKGDTRSFSVKVDVPKNPDEKLSPGMFARCTIRRYEKAGALTVPLDAGAEVSEKDPSPLHRGLAKPRARKDRGHFVYGRRPGGGGRPGGERSRGVDPRRRDARRFPAQRHGRVRPQGPRGNIDRPGRGAISSSDPRGSRL